MMIPFPRAPTESAGSAKGGLTGAAEPSRPAVAKKPLGRDDRALNMVTDTPPLKADSRQKNDLHGSAAALLATGPYGSQAGAVALRRDGEQLFAVVLLDREGRLLHRIGVLPEEEVVAVWQALGLATGLPLVAQDEDGEILELCPQLGRVRLGRVRQQRRQVLLSGRRPRFLTRRKTGRFPRRPRVHREPEIVTGLGA